MKWVSSMYTCILFLLDIPPSIPPLSVLTDPWAELPVLYSSFPLAIYFTHGTWWEIFYVIFSVWWSKKNTHAHILGHLKDLRIDNCYVIPELHCICVGAKWYVSPMRRGWGRIHLHSSESQRASVYTKEVVASQNCHRSTVGMGSLSNRRQQGQTRLKSEYTHHSTWNHSHILSKN